MPCAMPPVGRLRCCTRLMTAGVLVEVLVERGDLDGAERALGPLAAHLPGTSLTATIPRHARGRLRFAQRRFGEALSDFRAAGEIATGGLAISPSWLAWRSDAALAALAFGEPDTARRLSDEELELARAFGARRALGVAARAAGLVAGGRRGEALLREAIEVARRPRHPPRTGPRPRRPGRPAASPQPARRGPPPPPPSRRRRPPPRRRGAGRTG